jgi:hypothetical protein
MPPAAALFDDDDAAPRTMWIYLRIGVLYVAPALAVLIAAAAFVVLLRRVRRGVLSRAKAAWLYSTALLLPFAAIVVVWGVGELSSYFAAGGGEFVWDPGVSLRFLAGLLPLAGYVGVPIALLVIAFWAMMATGGRERGR